MRGEKRAITFGPSKNIIGSRTPTDGGDLSRNDQSSGLGLAGKKGRGKIGTFTEGGKRAIG